MVIPDWVTFEHRLGAGASTITSTEILESTRVDLGSVMESHPDLTNFGLCDDFSRHIVYYEDRIKSPPARRQIYESKRAVMLESRSLAQFWLARQWLQQFPKIAEHERNSSSYGLKHRAAKDIGYSTNGIFIAAGLSAGFQIERCGHDSPNVYFNINLRPFTCHKDSFNAYVMDRQAEDNPLGDFINDFKEDEHCLSHQFDTRDDLIDYLSDHNACDEAISQAKHIWAEYRRHFTGVA